MSMSDYIRACVYLNNVTKRKRQVHTPIADKTAIAELLGLLGQPRIANT